MYKIIATDDFMEVIKELSLKHINVLTNSFLSVERVNDEDIDCESSFISDLIEQVKNQELE